MIPRASTTAKTIIIDQIREYLYKNCEFGDTHIVQYSTLYAVLKSHFAQTTKTKLRKREFSSAMKV